VESEAPDNSQTTGRPVSWPYSGWVPTANGRLSFRHIGDTDYPERTSYANRVDPHDIRYILVRQRRDLSDAMLPQITDALTRRSGSFDFILSARSNQPTSRDDAEIVGEIFIVPVVHSTLLQNDTSALPDQSGASTNIPGKVEEAIANLNNTRTYAPPHPLEDDHVGITTWLKVHAPVIVAFSLARNGVIRLDHPLFSDQGLADRSIAGAKAIGVDFLRYLAEQAYFFVRDIAHVHQHHATQTDTLLGLQLTDTADIEWRNRLLFSLHHHVIAQRRSRDPAALMQSQGVIAYAESFAALSERELGPGALVAFESEALVRSVSASIKGAELATLENERKRAHIRQLCIWASVLLISILAIFVQPRLGIDEAGSYPLLHATSAFFAAHGGYAIFVAILVVIIPIFWHQQGLIDDKGRSWRNDLRLLLYFYPDQIRPAPVGIGMTLVLLAIWLFLEPHLPESLPWGPLQRFLDH
jgi:hypothetical protein